MSHEERIANLEMTIEFLKENIAELVRQLTEWPDTENKEYDPPLDKGIKHEVEILVENGIETYESCEGGQGHSYPEPTVRFHGERSEGFKALAIALQNDLKPSDLRRLWTIIDGEPTGPFWEMTFYHPSK